MAVANADVREQEDDDDQHAVLGLSRGSLQTPVRPVTVTSFCQGRPCRQSHFDGDLINNLADCPQWIFKLHQVLGDSYIWISYSSDLAQSLQVDRDRNTMTFWA